MRQTETHTDRELERQKGTETEKDLNCRGLQSPKSYDGLHWGIWRLSQEVQFKSKSQISS